MEWDRQIDAYCERLGPGLWAEPVNALTNAGFVLAALWLWPRVRGLPVARALCLLLAATGLGSALFHTFATPWAALLDVLPVAGFVLLYLYAANRRYLGLGRVSALAVTAAFPPAVALLAPVLARLPGLSSSAVYWPVPLLIAGYAALLARGAPRLARGLATGAALLTLSLAARSLDGPVCPALPLGTHFLWHLLNAAMLGWMIWVYRRHVLEARTPGR
ncbi:MAG: hypothetical protein ACU0AT_10920 [Tranquillimonas sp.]